MTARGTTLYAAPGDLKAWFEHAGPGQAARYASGGGLDERHETVRLVQGWKAAGLVECVATGGGAKPQYYRVRKRSLSVDPANAGSAVMPGVSGGLPAGDTDLGRVYAAVVAAAEAGLACPSNGRLAEMLDIDSRGRANSRFRARDLFNQLVRQGHLRVIAGSRFGARVVEVCASGLRTGSKERAE